MRIDKKTITKVSLILLSSITIIPNMVLASEATVIDDTHYYNNYYFFHFFSSFAWQNICPFPSNVTISACSGFILNFSTCFFNQL